MSDANGSNVVGQAWPTLLIMLLVGVGIISTPTPLKTARPRIDVDNPGQPFLEQTVAARLWQDPFLAVHAEHERLVRASSASSHQLANSRQSLRKENPNNILANGIKDRRKKGGVIVMPVLLSGGPYPEDREDRLRIRYAVHTALGVSGFVPERSDRIGYGWVPYDNFGANLVDSLDVKWLQKWLGRYETFLVPFEWFRSAEDREASPDSPAESDDGTNGLHEFDTVLILWIDENAIGSHLLKALTLLASIMGIPKGNEPEDSAISYRVLGPGTSTVLLAMAKELLALPLKDPGSGSGPRNHALPKNTAIYSARATIAPDEVRRLLPNLPCEHGDMGGDGIESLFATSNIKLRRTIGTDDELAEGLLRELRRRGKWSPDNETHIAIVTEWDSHYGRAWDNTFGDVADGLAGGNKADTHFHGFHYLRGLDGVASDDATPADAAEGTDAAIAIDRPEGRAQLDYVRRMARDMRREQEQFHFKFDAIGVLGSDIYDKLLVLRALREKFPSAVFFTTDLDARYLHPSEIRWSRNLIVASHYGLHAPGDYTGEIPMFRGSYQTSVFEACRLAIRGDANEPPSPEGKARVYEIGERREFDLAPCRPSGEASSLGGLGDRRPWLVRRLSRVVLAAIATAAAITIFVLLTGAFHNTQMLVQGASRRVLNLGQGLPNSFNAMVQRTVRAWRRGHVRLHIVFAGLRRRAMVHHLERARPLVLEIYALAGVALLAIILIDSMRTDGEPFVLFAGISTWPTTLIRFVVCIISANYLMYSLLELGRNRVLIEQRYLGSIHRKPRRRRSLARTNAVRSTTWLGQVDALRYWSRIGKGTSVRRVWQEYMELGVPWLRVKRTLLLTACYVVFFVCLFKLLGEPAHPYRGAVNQAVNTLVLIFSVLHMLFLILFVLDATVLCNGFLRWLGTEGLDWREVVERLRDRTGDLTSISEPPLKEKNKGTKKADRPKKAADSATPMKDVTAFLTDKDVMQVARLRMAARRSEAVARLVYLPYIVMFLMFVSRSREFDNWDWPLSLTLVFVFNVAITVLCWAMLRRTAESLREEAIRHFEDARMGALYRGDSDAKDLYKEVIDEVQGIARGAFAPLSQNPVLRAVLIPFGGVGALALADYFTKLG